MSDAKHSPHRWQKSPFGGLHRIDSVRLQNGHRGRKITAVTGTTENASIARIGCDSSIARIRSPREANNAAIATRSIRFRCCVRCCQPFSVLISVGERRWSPGTNGNATIGKNVFESSGAPHGSAPFREDTLRVIIADDGRHPNVGENCGWTAPAAPRSPLCPLYEIRRQYGSDRRW